MRHLLEHRHLCRAPIFPDGLETLLRVIGLAAFVIFAADQHEILAVGTGLKAHIMIGLFRIPIERVRQSAALIANPIT